MLDGFQQLRVLLAHDPVELRRAHPAVLHLLERLAGLNALVLPRVAYDEYAVLRLDLVEKRFHLLRTGKTGLVQEIEMPVGRVARCLALVATYKEALKRRRAHSSVAELTGGAGGRGEAFDGIAVLLRALTDGFKRGGFSCSRESLQAVHPVPAGQNLVDHTALRFV